MSMDAEAAVETRPLSLAEMEIRSEIIPALSSLPQPTLRQLQPAAMLHSLQADTFLPERLRKNMMLFVVSGALHVLLPTDKVFQSLATGASCSTADFKDMQLNARASDDGCVLMTIKESTFRSAMLERDADYQVRIRRLIAAVLPCDAGWQPTNIRMQYHRGGSVIVRQGDPVESLSWLESGCLSCITCFQGDHVSQDTKPGQHGAAPLLRSVASLRAGDSLGAMAHAHPDAFDVLRECTALRTCLTPAKAGEGGVARVLWRWSVCVPQGHEAWVMSCALARWWTRQLNLAAISDDFANMPLVTSQGRGAEGASEGKPWKEPAQREASQPRLRWREKEEVSAAQATRLHMSSAQSREGRESGKEKEMGHLREESDRVRQNGQSLDEGGHGDGDDSKRIRISGTAVGRRRGSEGVPVVPRISAGGSAVTSMPPPTSSQTRPTLVPSAKTPLHRRLAAPKAALLRLDVAGDGGLADLNARGASDATASISRDIETGRFNLVRKRVPAYTTLKAIGRQNIEAKVADAPPHSDTTLAADPDPELAVAGANVAWNLSVPQPPPSHSTPHAKPSEGEQGVSATELHGALEVLALADKKTPSAQLHVNLEWLQRVTSNHRLSPTSLAEPAASGKADAIDDTQDVAFPGGPRLAKVPLRTRLQSFDLETFPSPLRTGRDSLARSGIEAYLGTPRPPQTLVGGARRIENEAAVIGCASSPIDARNSCITSWGGSPDGDKRESEEGGIGLKVFAMQPFSSAWSWRGGPTEVEEGAEERVYEMPLARDAIVSAAHQGAGNLKLSRKERVALLMGKQDVVLPKLPHAPAKNRSVFDRLGFSAISDLAALDALVDQL